MERDPAAALEEALRIARAATHEHKLERPVAEAFRAIIDLGHAAVDAYHVQQRDMILLRREVSILQMLESTRVHRDP